MKFLFLILVSQITLAQNPFWVSKDKKLLTNLAKIDKSNPTEVESYFREIHKKRSIKKIDLGFGWEIWNASVGGGYISIDAQVYYYKDSIVSYSIHSQLPDEERLQEKYKRWYQNIFDFDKDEIIPFVFKEENILQPLSQFPDSLEIMNTPPELLHYMSPKSGLIYGHSGGYSGEMLANRAYFHDIKHKLNKSHIILAMYSINPASRFTAIETYLRNKSKYPQSTEIENWIEKNFKEIPRINTLFGCIMESWDSRALVYLYVGS